MYIQSSQFIAKYHKQSLQIVLWQSIGDESFALPRVIDKSDQNRQNTYLAVSWQILFFVHSNFTDYLRIAQAIITNSFGAKCSGWHVFTSPRLLIKLTKLGKTHIWLYLGKEWFLYIQTSQFIAKYHKQSLQIVLWQSIGDEIFAPSRVLTNLTKIGKTHI